MGRDVTLPDRAESILAPSFGIKTWPKKGRSIELVVDLDGVILSFITALLLNVTTSLSPFALEPTLVHSYDPQTYDLDIALGLDTGTLAALVGKTITQEKIDLIDPTIPAILAGWEEFAEISFATERPLFADHYTRLQVDRLGLGKYNIYFLARDEMPFAHIYINDSLRRLYSCHEIGHPARLVVFNQPWNQSLNLNGFIWRRVHSWWHLDILLRNVWETIQEGKTPRERAQG